MKRNWSRAQLPKMRDSCATWCAKHVSLENFNNIKVLVQAWQSHLANYACLLSYTSIASQQTVDNSTLSAWLT